MITALFVITALILINAFYVAAEFATVGTRRTRLRQLAEAGNHTARRLAPVLDDPGLLDRYIATCQIGITLSSLVLGAYGQAAFGPQLGARLAAWTGVSPESAFSLAAALILIALTVTQVVLGELIPKSVALELPTQTALLCARPMFWSLALFNWFIAVTNGSSALLLRAVGLQATGHRHIHSPDEIDMLIVESSDGGLLEPEERHRLRNALRLSSRTARQLMIPRTRIVALSVDTPLDEAAERLLESPYTRLPVYDGTIDTIMGILHTKSLARMAAEAEQPPTLTDLIQPVIYVPENMQGDQLLTVMREQHTQVAIVADEYGGVAGLITLEDVLSELLGDVGDEFKSSSLQAEPLPDGRVRLPGDMRLDEAESWLGDRWQGRAVTVGGHVVESLGHVPAKGAHLVIDGINVEIAQVHDHAIAIIIVGPVAGTHP